SMSSIGRMVSSKQLSLETGPRSSLLIIVLDASTVPDPARCRFSVRRPEFAVYMLSTFRPYRVYLSHRRSEPANIGKKRERLGRVAHARAGRPSPDGRPFFCLSK